VVRPAASVTRPPGARSTNNLPDRAVELLRDVRKALSFRRQPSACLRQRLLFGGRMRSASSGAMLPAFTRVPTKTSGAGASRSVAADR
jgi:hypothetical protein